MLMYSIYLVVTKYQVLTADEGWGIVAVVGQVGIGVIALLTDELVRLILPQTRRIWLVEIILMGLLIVYIW
jgi:hypothetical protein